MRGRAGPSAALASATAIKPMATLPAIVVVQRLTQRVDQRRERGLPVISASDYRTDSRTAAAAAAASPVSAASVWLPVAASTSVTTPATHRRRARSLADRGAEGPVHQGASERGDTHGLGHVDGGGGLGGGLAQRRRRRMSHAWRRPSRVVDTAVLEMASGRLGPGSARRFFLTQSRGRGQRGAPMWRRR